MRTRRRRPARPNVRRRRAPRNGQRCTHLLQYIKKIFSFFINLLLFLLLLSSQLRLKRPVSINLVLLLEKYSEREFVVILAVELEAFAMWLFNLPLPLKLEQSKIRLLLSNAVLVALVMRKASMGAEI